MKLKSFDVDLTICKVAGIEGLDLSHELTFLCVTDEEVSFVCPTAFAPENAVAREDGWRAFRIEGVLDFSLKGILARISGVLAEAEIGIFVVSTYNTDYVLVKADDLQPALGALAQAGYAMA